MSIFQPCRCKILLFQIKYTKTFDDSTIGARCRPTFTTATKNGGSPFKCSVKFPPKNDEIHNEIFILGRENLKSRNIVKSKSDIEVSNFRRRFTVPKLQIQDLNTTYTDEEKLEANVTEILTPIDTENIQFVDYMQNANSFLTHRSDYQVSKDNRMSRDSNENKNGDSGSHQDLDSSDKSLEDGKQHSSDIKDQCNLNTTNEQNLGSKGQNESLDHCNLRLPKRLIHSLEYCSENLLSPRSKKYDEVSEDYGSSRSESPSDRRSGKRMSIFRRESRFRSIRGRNFETGKMTPKDKKLLKMILVIFSAFLICYLPITITKIFKDLIDWRGLNIAGYILIYLTTCINPVIYVIMSSEYRSAYKNVLLCRSDSSRQMNKISRVQEKKKKTDSGSK